MPQKRWINLFIFAFWLAAANCAVLCEVLAQRSTNAHSCCPSKKEIPTNECSYCVQQLSPKELEKSLVKKILPLDDPDGSIAIAFTKAPNAWPNIHSNDRIKSTVLDVGNDPRSLRLIATLQISPNAPPAVSIS